jgi:acetyltransferase-like isoleucine patch superfamily enzyme
MKNLIKKIISVFYKIKPYLSNRLKANSYNKIKLPAIFFNSVSSIDGKNNSLKGSGKFDKCRFVIEGNNNQLDFNDSIIAGSSITVSGNNNKICFEKGIYLITSVITIRGEGCLVYIGNNSTFGGVRIVNTGNSNHIHIGADCLFSDHIEIWASDTHPIFDEQKNIINKEKPIVIGDKVWVGSRVIILKGVTIRSGSIIGMGTVVVKDVPEFSISVGSPNRTVKNNINWFLT